MGTKKRKQQKQEKSEKEWLRQEWLDENWLGAGNLTEKDFEEWLQKRELERELFEQEMKREDEMGYEYIREKLNKLLDEMDETIECDKRQGFMTNFSKELIYERQRLREKCYKYKKLKK
jgi:hypothetical protein